MTLVNKVIDMKKECTTCAKEKCPMHPDYQAKRKPRCTCKTCWEIWEKKQEERNVR